MHPLLLGLPLMSHREEHAESADFFVEFAQPLRDMLRTADNPQRIQQILQTGFHVGNVRILSEFFPAKQAEPIIPKIASESAFECLFARLFGCIGDVDFAGDAPRGTRWREPRLRCTFLNGIPMRFDNGDWGQIDAHRNPAALACQNKRVGFGRRAGHRNRRMRFLIRFHVDADDVRARFGNFKLPEIAFVVARLRVRPNFEDSVNSLACCASSVALGHEHFRIARRGT